MRTAETSQGNRTLVPGAVDDADTYLAAHPDTRAHFERVAELVEGFETPFGLELLSTVHWLATREDAGTEEAIVAGAYAWSDRKKQFSERQLRWTC